MKGWLSEPELTPSLSIFPKYCSEMARLKWSERFLVAFVKKDKPNHLVKVCILLTFLTCAMTSLAQEFESSGSFKSEAFSPRYKDGTEPCFILEGDFFVAVKDCSSEVKYKTKNVIWHLKEFESSEAGAILSFDGTNYYELILPNSAFTNALPSGKIWTGQVPERSDDKLATLWLAFGSHCYFKTADSNLIYSPLMSSPTGRNVWTNDHRVPATWTLLSDFPQLPVNIVHSSEFAFNSKQGEPIISNIVYRVLTTTNFDGVTLPKNFQLNRYFPAASLVNSFSAELSDIKLHISNQNFIPPLQKRTFIIDERFIGRAGNPVAQYLQKSTNWPTLDEGERNLEKVARNDSDATRKLARPITLIAMMLLALVPVGLLVKQIKNKKRKGQLK